MYLEQAIFNYLVLDTGLNAQIAQRIFPDELPQNSELPAIVYSLISSIPSDFGHDGSAGIESRIQFSCLAKSFAEAKTIAVKLKKALRPFEQQPGIMGGLDGLKIAGCFLDNELTIFEPNEVEEISRIHRPVDYIFLHEEDY